MMARFNQLDIDDRHLSQPDRRVIMKIALFERAVFKRQALLHNLAGAPQRGTPDLRLNVLWIDGNTHIHRNGESVDGELTRIWINGNLGDPGHPGRTLAFFGGRYSSQNLPLYVM